MLYYCLFLQPNNISGLKISAFPYTQYKETIDYSRQHFDCLLQNLSGWVTCEWIHHLTLRQNCPICSRRSLLLLAVIHVLNLTQVSWKQCVKWTVMTFWNWLCLLWYDPVSLWWWLGGLLFSLELEKYLRSEVLMEIVLHHWRSVGGPTWLESVVDGRPHWSLVLWIQKECNISLKVHML